MIVGTVNAGLIERGPAVGEKAASRGPGFEIWRSFALLTFNRHSHPNFSNGKYARQLHFVSPPSTGRT